MSVETGRKLEYAYVCHDRGEKEQETFPVLAHVSLGELDADGKDADREDNPCQFEGDVSFGVVVSPSSWIEYSGSIGTWKGERDERNANERRYFGLTDDNSEEERPDRFSNIELRGS